MPTSARQRSACMTSQMGKRPNGLAAEQPPKKRSAATLTETVATPVDIPWDKLASGEGVSEALAQAFGPGSLGILTLSGLPPRVAELRREVLHMARTFAQLPPETLSKYELHETGYIVGWSRGREKFKGKPDYSKGSFYANPIYDEPAAGDAKLLEKFPYLAPNVWPTEAGENFEGAFKELGKLMFDIAQPLVVACDRYIAAELGVEKFDVLSKACYSGSRLQVGRLLHYYAGDTDGGGTSSDDTWCGWHNDNSVVSVLVPGLMLYEDTGEEVPREVLSGNTAGLVAKSGDGATMRVPIPSDRLGVQVGEAAQILSGGILRATPHAVRGFSQRGGADPQLAKISRESMALFIEPNWDYAMNAPKGRELKDIWQDEELYPEIPPLSSRLPTLPVEFGQFLGDSFKEYSALDEASKEEQ